MTQTEKLSLNLIAPSDPLDPGVINANMEALDEVYAPTNKPYVTGTYTGNGTSSQTIELGFAATCVIANMDYLGSSSSSRSGNYTGIGIVDLPVVSDTGVKLTDTGFIVSNGTYGPNTNAGGRTYHYIAFK